MEEKYLIATTRHKGVYPGTLLFWGQDRCGYTSDINHAGRYSEAEAKELTAGNGDTPIAESLVQVMPKMLVSDIGELHNLNLLRAKAEQAAALVAPVPQGMQSWVVMLPVGFKNKPRTRYTCDTCPNAKPEMGRVMCKANVFMCPLSSATPLEAK